MTNRKWILSGLYGGAISLGWLGAFLISGYIERQHQLPEGSALEKIDAVAPTQNNRISTKTKTTSTTKTVTKHSYITTITKRNIFDSSVAITPPKVEEAPTPTNEVGETNLPVELLGTVVIDPPEQSVAWIKDTSQNKATGYGIGDDLLGQAKIETIEQTQVSINRNGAIEILKFTTKNKEKKKSTKKDKKSGVDTAGIEKSGKDKYIVDRALVEEMEKNPQALGNIRWQQKEDENGNIIGFRMAGIRRSSVLYKLGVKNGDIVHNVNGQALTSLNAAMDAYGSLSNSNNFSFEITRRKKRRTLQYEIR